MATRKALVLVVLLVVMMMTVDARAAYPYEQTDSTHYYRARKCWDPSAAYYSISCNNNTGYLQVCGDHDIPWGPDECGLVVEMRFMAPSSGLIRVRAAWSLSYKLETNFPLGTAKIRVRYVLYSDNLNALESHDKYANSVSTPWWGGYNSVSAIVNQGADQSILFTYSLSAGTYYRVGVQLYLYLDAEANAWSQAGYPNAANLDVNDLVVDSW